MVTRTGHGGAVVLILDPWRARRGGRRGGGWIHGELVGEEGGGRIHGKLIGAEGEVEGGSMASSPGRKARWRADLWRTVVGSEHVGGRDNGVQVEPGADEVVALCRATHRRGSFAGLAGDERVVRR
jgi:hypothetical protein